MNDNGPIKDFEPSGIIHGKRVPLDQLVDETGIWNPQDHPVYEPPTPRGTQPHDDLGKKIGL